jgi:hypothetical protein
MPLSITDIWMSATWYMLSILQCSISLTKKRDRPLRKPCISWAWLVEAGDATTAPDGRLLRFGGDTRVRYSIVRTLRSQHGYYPEK